MSAINLHRLAAGRGLKDADARRDLFERETGKRSQSEMTPAEVAKVAKVVRSSTAAPSKGDRWRKPSAKPHVKKVYALWWRLAEAGVVARGRDRHLALRAFIGAETFRKKWGEQATDAEFLSPDRANDVIEALKAMARREGIELEERR